jgi:hypothetical protein
LFPLASVRKFYALELPSDRLGLILAVAAAGSVVLIATWLLRPKPSAQPPGG